MGEVRQKLCTGPQTTVNRYINIPKHHLHWDNPFLCIIFSFFGPKILSLEDIDYVINSVILGSNPSPHVKCAMHFAQFDLTPLFVWFFHPWSLHVPCCCDPCLSLASHPPYAVIGSWWYATITSSLMSRRVTPINSFPAKSFASSSCKPSLDRKWSKSNQSSESFKERRKGCWSC